MKGKDLLYKSRQANFDMKIVWPPKYNRADCKMLRPEKMCGIIIKEDKGSVFIKNPRKGGSSHGFCFFNER